MSPATKTIAYARHDVTAVLVTHDGDRWVGRVLDALAIQDRPVQRVVAVDTGSRDGTLEVLHEHLGQGRVLARPRDVGFGQAVAFGVGAVYGVEPAPHVTGHPDEPVDWIWILHDDAEPSTDALSYLLALVDADPEIAVAGPKVLGWYNSREILEVGLTIAPNGRRETGLDQGEEDQGQHDGKRGVLAVGSAGMLIRRDVWDALGGFDRNLTFMRDDIDFCWRVNAAGWRVVVNTDAVVYHAEAAARGRRRIAARVRRPHYLDRAHALYVLLANLHLAKLPLALVRLTAGSLGRAFGYTVAKLPDYAIDELLALGSAYGRMPSIAVARLRRRRSRRIGAKRLRPLFPARWSQLRHTVDTIAEQLPHSHFGTDLGRHRVEAAESGPVSEEAEDLEGNDVPITRRIARQPLVVLMVTLVVLTLLAARDLIGGGRLMGGALLPAPNSAADLWDVYIASWHPVGVGSGAAATPYIGAVAALATALFGNPSHAVDLLLIGAVPLSGLSAYLVARKVVNSRLLRLWAAGAYALLPAVTGAVATGRIGTAAGAVLLPIAALGVIRTLGLDGKPGTWRAAWTTGLLLAIMTAFVPVAWLLAAVLAVVAVGLRVRRTSAILRLGAVLATPVFVLLPWSIALLKQPSLIFLEAGLPGPGLSDAQVDAIGLLLLHPGGPGMYPVWISAGVLSAGFAALLRIERRGLVAGGWAVALTGLVVGLFMSRAHVTGPTLAAAVPAWPGFPTVVMGAGLLLAALIGAEGARDRIARASFGWKQPLSITVSLMAIIAPVVAGLWWVRFGADDPIERRNPVLLPAFVAAEGESTDRPRTLVLQMRGAGQLSYSLVRDVGPGLGDAETAPRTGTYAGLDQIVREVASGRGGDQVDKLADYAIRYVLLTAPVDQELVRILDAVPGLSRVSINEDGGLWRLSIASARLRIVPPSPAEGEQPADPAAAAEVVTVPSAGVDASAQVLPGPAGRTLVLAENADSGWQAALDGRPLPATTYNGWAQAFELPETGGQLTLSHDSPARDRWLLVQLLAIAVVVVLALPAGRRVDQPLDVDEGAALERRRRVRAPAFPDDIDVDLDLDHAGLSTVGSAAGEFDGRPEPYGRSGIPAQPPYGLQPPPYGRPIDDVPEPVPMGHLDYAGDPPWPAAPGDHLARRHDGMPMDDADGPMWDEGPFAGEHLEPLPPAGLRPSEPPYYPTEPVLPHQSGHDTLAGSYEVVQDERFGPYDHEPPTHQIPAYQDGGYDEHAGYGPPAPDHGGGPPESDDATADYPVPGFVSAPDDGSLNNLDWRQPPYPADPYGPEPQVLDPYGPDPYGAGPYGVDPYPPDPFTEEVGPWPRDPYDQSQPGPGHRPEAYPASRERISSDRASPKPDVSKKRGSKRGGSAGGRHRGRHKDS